ncbi:MAG TPA: hypothetical protein VHE61_00650 [Opitutaceae bacterium]|nr:hypothetical protein [Opitutaceae bacterium]
MAPGYGWISGPEPAEHLERSGIGFGTLTVLAGSLSVTMDNETHPIVGPLPVFGKTIGIHTDELTQFKLSGRRPLAHGSATSTCPVRAYVRITGNPVPLVYCGEPTPPHAPAIIVQFAL